MKKSFSWLAVPAIMLPVSALAMQALEDDVMAQVSGQAGITIELTTSDPNGVLLSTGEIKFTEKDNDGKGNDYVAIGGLTLRTLMTDGAGTVIGADTIKTTIDVDAGGNVVIRNKDIDTLDLELTDINFSGRTMFGAVRLSVWEFVDDSYLETVLMNDPAGSKIAFRTVMREGSGLTFQFDEDDVTFSSDVVFMDASNGNPFSSEIFLTGNNDELKLEFGRTKGTIEIRNISILDENGTPVFGANNFGDVGFGDINVNTGYVTVSASKDATRDGIEGRINADLSMGTAFYRTGDQRVNARNVQVRTNGEIGYQLDFYDSGATSGIEARVFDISDMDLIIGALTLSSGDGSNESVSLGSYAIENLNLHGNSMELGIYTMPGAGSEGMRMDFSIAGQSSFDLTIKDDAAKISGRADPTLTAEIVMNNISVSQTIDQTNKGLHIGIYDGASMDLSVNSIRIGDGHTHQGQTGRLVMNDISLQPGSYFRIEPLQ